MPAAKKSTANRATAKASPMGRSQGHHQHDAIKHRHKHHHVSHYLHRGENWAHLLTSSIGARAPVRLVHYDDASSPARAAANAERLLDGDAVEVLIGPYASDLTRAVLPVARRRGRVLWNHGGASDDIHMGGGRAVGILTPVSRYFGGLLELVRSLDPDAARVALLHRRGSGFGRLAALGVRAVASDAMFVTDVVTYSSLASDLPSVMASLERQSPDLVISAGSFDDEVVLARALLESGLRQKAVGLAAAAM